jgi:hypothetical protein
MLYVHYLSCQGIISVLAQESQFHVRAQDSIRVDGFWVSPEYKTEVLLHSVAFFPAVKSVLHKISSCSIGKIT